MDQRAVASLHRIGEIGDGFGVERLGEFGIVLRSVDIGICRAIYNHIDVVGVDRFDDLFRIGDIQIGHVGENIIVPRILRGVSYAGAQLAVRARYKYIHFLYGFMFMSSGESKSFNNGCFRSFSLKIAQRGSMRQSMPSEASAIEIPPSACGA